MRFLRALPQLPSLRAIVLALAIVGTGAAIIGFLLAWSGLYSVAASRGHWPITTKFLEFGLRNSIETHSLGISPPRLDDIGLIRLGAGHFASGCAVCHGSPGSPRSAVFNHMLPHPPSLSDAAKNWKADELYWIVKNGLKFTGMPAWPAQERGDEVWAVVAFLLRLTELTPDAYRQLANLDLPEAKRPAGGDRGQTRALQACIGCHGDSESEPISPLIPRLRGQSATYLEFSLRSYRDGTRSSGIMQQFASTLADEEIAGMSTWFAQLPVHRAEDMPSGTGPEQAERGRAIAEKGIAEAGVPPCLSCHGQQRRGIFPQLAGQHGAYISQQLTLWKEGLRQQTAPGQIMSVIARRLSPADIRDVASFFESLPPGEYLRQ
jgi:cytochrome c553